MDWINDLEGSYFRGGDHNLGVAAILLELSHRISKGSRHRKSPRNYTKRSKAVLIEVSVESNYLLIILIELSPILKYSFLFTFI